MAAPFIIPFNFQPESVNARTTSYTIPAGKYAYAVPSTCALTVNSNLIFTSGRSSLTLPTTTGSYPISNGFSGMIALTNNNAVIARVVLSNPSAATYSSETALISFGSTFVIFKNGEITFWSGGTISSSSTVGPRYNANYIIGGSTTNTVLVDIYGENLFGAWYPTGTILGGSSVACPWFVTEYSMIS